jgi:hypothetical protein
MRSWYPIPASKLDNKRLLAEHNEIYIFARTIAGINNGWANHPETNRWRGHSKALKMRHDELAQEMIFRGMNHKSPWPDILINLNDTDKFPNTTWEPLEIMIRKLEEKQRK